MRGKPRSSRPKVTAVGAVAGCLASCLATTLAPAHAAPADGQAAQATPGVMVAGQPVGIAADATNHTFWVAVVNAGKATDIVDKIAETGHAVTTLHVTSGVNGIAADATRGLIWTIGNSANGSTHTVSYIRTSNDSVHAVHVPASTDLTGLAVDPQAGKVFVLDLSGDVFTLDESGLANAPVEFITGGLSEATGLAIDHGNESIWVLNAGGNSVFEFSASTGVMIGSPASVGDSPGVIAVDTTTKTVWVGNADSTISEFAESTPGTVNSLTLGSTPISVTPDPARHTIWVGGEFGSIYRVTEQTSPPSLARGLTLPNEVDGLAIDAKTGQLWATQNVTSQGTFNNVVPFVPTAPAFTSANSTWFAAGNTAQDQFTLNASGFPPASFAMRGAPSWLSLAKLTGVLSGKLTRASKLGAFKVTVTASNGIGSPVQLSFTVNVGTDPVIATTSATFAFGVNAKNAFQIKASGTPAPTFAGLKLPKGLHLSKAGLLTGSLPKGTASPQMFRIEASNKVTQAFRSPVIAKFRLRLVPGARPKFTSAAKVTFRHGRPAHFTISTSGFPAPSLKISGKLPMGLRIKIRGDRAFISGTPAAAGQGRTFKITITATNGIAKPATQTLAIKIT